MTYMLLLNCALKLVEEIILILLMLTVRTGHAVAQLDEACATSRKVVSSIPDGVTGIFL